jgi:hypothetical protein
LVGCQVVADFDDAANLEQFEEFVSATPFLGDETRIGLAMEAVSLRQ